MLKKTWKTSLSNHIKDNGYILEGAGQDDEKVPNHVEIGLFLGIKEGADCIGEPTCQHEEPEDQASMLDDGWKDEDDQPAHDQIEDEAKFFIDLFGKNLIKNAKDGGPPLDDENEIANPVVHDGQDNWRIAARNGDVNHTVVNDAQDILVGRAIGHGVVDGRGEKHEKKADDKDRGPKGLKAPVEGVGVDGRIGQKNQHPKGRNGMGNCIAHFLSERELFG